MWVLQALFLGEERRRSLATHGHGGRKVICVRIHGEEGRGREVWWGNGEEDERKVREKWDEEREKVVTNEVG